MAKEIGFNEKASLDRPAWTQADLHAYRHKCVGTAKIDNDIRPAVIHNHYVRTRGLRK